MWRDPPELTGLEAQTSGVPRTAPKVLENRFFWMELVEKCGWLRTLKNFAAELQLKVF